MSNFALSTMYFQRWTDQSDLSPFFDLALEMGFRAFELGHVLGPRAVRSAESRRAPVIAVHHPCPNADHDPRCDITSLDRERREAAAQAIRRTFGTARRLGTRAVVLHLGAIEDGDGTLGRLRFELDSRYRAGQRDSPRYGDALAQLRALVAEREALHLTAGIETLADLVGEAAGEGLALGLETGYHPHELPTPAGMGRLLGEIAAPELGAWLDTGHVGAQEHRGLVSGLGEWYEAVGHRWLGAHLHDVAGLRDHLVPGMGSLDFGEILRHLPDGIVLTCEVDWYFSPDEVRAGIAHLERCAAA